MPVFTRKIDEKLLLWKNSPTRRPLILRGARQIGKSFAIRQFAKCHYERFFEVNFEQRPSYKKLFTKDLDPKRIIAELALLFGSSIRPGLDLIFFDEVQDCPEAITALRYFYEQAGDYHIVAAGSLLEFAMAKISVPVGRIDYEYMYPMCFSEFLAAINCVHLIPYLPTLAAAESFVATATAMELIYAALRDYFIVGGMPAVVATFVTTKSYIAVGVEQDNILRTFKDDIHKYAKGDLKVLNLEKLLESCLKHVGKQIKYTTLSTDTDIRRTKASVELLEKACLLSRVRSVNPNGLPLGAEASDKFFKLIFFDIGLGQRWAGYSQNDTIASENFLALYEGRLAEQFVGQQLLAESLSASEDRSLYCWIRPVKNSQAEVDYLIVRGGKIIAIEVKSGPAGRMKSLGVLQAQYPNIKQLICVQQSLVVQVSGGITFLPLFAIL